MMEERGLEVARVSVSVVVMITGRRQGRTGPGVGCAGWESEAGEVADVDAVGNRSPLAKRSDWYEASRLRPIYPYICHIDPYTVQAYMDMAYTHMPYKIRSRLRYGYG